MEQCRSRPRTIHLEVRGTGILELGSRGMLVDAELAVRVHADPVDHARALSHTSGQGGVIPEKK